MNNNLMNNNQSLNLKDIKSDYNYFLMYLNVAYSILSFLVQQLSIYLQNNYDSINYDEIYTDNLELNLAYFKDIYEILYKALEYAENISINELQMPTAKICNFYNYINIPPDYEQDICVDMNNLPNIKSLYKFK